jgi:cell division protein FtsL
MTATTIRNQPIRQPDRRSLAEFLRIAALIFLAATPFIVYVGLSARMVAKEYELSRLVESRKKLLHEHEILTLQRAALLSPDVINSVAREKLGMVSESPQECSVDQPPPAPDRPETSGRAPAAPNADGGNAPSTKRNARGGRAP